MGEKQVTSLAIKCVVFHATVKDDRKQVDKMLHVRAVVHMQKTTLTIKRLIWTNCSVFDQYIGGPTPNWQDCLEKGAVALADADPTLMAFESSHSDRDRSNWVHTKDGPRPTTI
eukprot:scaffold7_cov414-Pavlova_lutheri.AAC.16